ncbi:hypothetical protein ACEQ38_24120 (plasmid) [Ralstonia syzygii subsp. celebesensis]|uniref:hypothetical protein n=1 Tax=Ralstonia syzygii TaxID=28097 RepID=UPI0012FD5277|nr:hypothetical protein [Ralstonia syzygii]
MVDDIAWALATWLPGGRARVLALEFVLGGCAAVSFGVGCVGTSEKRNPNNNKPED